MLSKNGVPVRLTDERWAHITEEHNELAGLRFEVLSVLSEPSETYQGSHEELLATKELQEGLWLVVVYREYELDGFVITAFLTSRKRYLERRVRLWP